MSKELNPVFERFAIGLYSFLLALLTGSFIWLMLFYEIAWFWSIDSQPLYYPVIVFSLFMGLLGFLLKTNLLANIFAFIWSFLAKLARYYF